MRRILTRLVAFSVLWWALTQGDGLWYYGIPVVLAVTALTVVLDAKTATDRRPFPARIRAAVGVLWWFLKHSVTGTVDVARRVLRRTLDIDPFDAHLDLTLQSPSGRVLLATLGSLTPGSLSVALTDNRLDLHLLHRELPSTEQLRELEHYLVVLLDPPSDHELPSETD